MFRVPEHRFLFCGGKFTSSSVGARSDGLQGYMQLASAENVQHAFQIVGGYGQVDFRLRPPQSTQQEAWMSGRHGISNWQMDVPRWLVVAAYRLRRGPLLACAL